MNYELSLYIGNLLDGVSIDGIYIKRIETENMLDGTVFVNIRSEDKLIGNARRR